MMLTWRWKGMPPEGEALADTLGWCSCSARKVSRGLGLWQMPGGLSRACSLMIVRHEGETWHAR